MTVSTRSHSQISTKSKSNEQQQQQQGGEEIHNVPMRNLHHGLKEKLRELTLLYEQQKKASAVLRNSSNDNNVMKENTIPITTTSAPMANSKAFDDSKENLFIGTDHKILGVSSFATKGTDTAVARKLSMEMNEKNDSRIRVFVRLRPMSKKEKEVGSRCCVKIVNKKDVYLTEYGDESYYLRLKRLKGRHFTFDASFPDSSTQYDVYTTTTAELVEAVLRGRNGSVFCYGSTGAGKTYTMLGTVDNPGVVVLAIKDLFTKIRQKSFDGNHVVHLSYLEVYNETVRDLFSPGRPLVLREDKQGIAAAGFTQYRAYSADEVMALLQRGNQNRITEPTRANETSSRSHAILQVVVEYRVKDASMNVINRVGKLSFIDLAGSERALATDQSTLRSLEGANINRSLLALSSCINALAERKTHIPYRNSKLTQLLKDSLGGACNTVMITNISPSNVSFGETQSTLHWADRAKEIRTKACEANEEVLALPETRAADQTKLVLELQKENRELQIQLVRQRQKLLSFQSQSIAANADISPPTPTSLTSITTPPSTSQPAKKMKLKPSILARNFTTPESRKRAAEEAVNELKLRVTALESEMARMKKDHTLELKQKEDIIRELSRKNEKPLGQSKSPNHRFQTPITSKTKKRSFWDITTANSPSIATSNARKTRSHTTSQPFGAPSMLLQPGFARQRPDVLKK